MMQAVTFTITPATLGVIAVMIVFGVVAGLVIYFITSLVVFTGIDNGNYEILAILRIPLTIAAVIGGAYLGYQLMS
jgi:hypothetical protein